MGKIITALVLAAVALGSSARGRLEPANLVDQEATKDPLLSRCFYRTLGGFEFAMISRGICPFSVRVNPETGEIVR